MAATTPDGDEEDAFLVEALETGVGGEAAVEDKEAEGQAAGMGEVEELEDGCRAGLAADGGVGTEQEASMTLTLDSRTRSSGFNLIGQAERSFRRFDYGRTLHEAGILISFSRYIPYADYALDASNGICDYGRPQ